ncbi:hypothetical protein AVEN_176785-1, partial [Araneus ventricosus]
MNNLPRYKDGSVFQVWGATLDILDSYGSLLNSGLWMTSTFSCSGRFKLGRRKESDFSLNSDPLDWGSYCDFHQIKWSKRSHSKRVGI